MKKATARKECVDEDCRADKPLFSTKYKVNDLTVDLAACLYGDERLRNISYVVSLLMFAVVIVCALSLGNQIVILGIAVVCTAIFSTIASNWERLQRRFILKTNLFTASLNTTRSVMIDSEKVTVEVPEMHQFDTLPLTQLKRVRANNDGCLADFGKMRVAYIPRKGMTKERYHNLITFFDVNLMTNKLSKHAKAARSAVVQTAQQE